MNKTYDCGCSFNTQDGKVLLTTSDIENLPDCEYTWQMFHEGKTRGIFQLENNLGRKWAKETKPNSILELADLLSIIRPGTLESKIGDKSSTECYADRKHGLEPVEYLHPSLENILRDTYGVMLYQESSLEIAKQICGFNLEQADILRRGIGKKSMEVINSLKDQFLDGAEKVGLVKRSEADEMFEWIKNCNRYLFGKAHAVGYAFVSYWSAYIKTHFPRHFFCSYLMHAFNKPKPQREVRELINDAHLFGVEAKAPDFRTLEENFHIEGKNIRFGMANIKDVGPALMKKVLDFQSELNLSTEDVTWVDFLLDYSKTVGKRGVKALISAGALDFFGMSRKRMVFEYEKYQTLTDGQKKLAQKQRRETLAEIMLRVAPIRKEGGASTTNIIKERTLSAVRSLESPPFSLDDNKDTIIEEETNYLGLPITYTKIDSVENYPVNTTCRDIVNENAKSGLVLAVVIDNVKIHKIKTGKNRGLDMAFLTVHDKTGQIDNVVLFTDKYLDYSNLLEKDNAVLIVGDYNPSRDSVVVNKVVEL